MSHSRSRRATRFVAVFAAVLVPFLLTSAHASGPTERLVQLLVSPKDPNVLIVRYGLASEGYLFSRDGGRSFRAMCSQSVAPELVGIDRIKRISYNEVPATAANAVDGSGRVIFSQYGSMWTDDGTGCKWSRIPEFDGTWPFSIKTDPHDPNVLWSIISTSIEEGPTAKTQPVLMRRDAAGTWAAAGMIRNLTAGQVIFQGDLLVAPDGTKTRHYGLVHVGDRKSSVIKIYSVASQDGGKTWQESVLPNTQADLRLLAIDPANPKRVLAVIPRDSEPDDLLLSEDEGATFKKYTTLRGVSDVTFDEQGRVYFADAGDSSSADSVGGLFTAAKLGEPLTRVGKTEYIDCVRPQPGTGKLYVCSRDRFGVADPTTGAIEELVQLGAVPDLLECPGRDMYAICETELNAGPSWCCAGHYPFTPFCGEYNVTKRPDGFRVFCGLAGREYDGPPADAGVGADAGATSGRDAGVDGGAAPSGRDAGTSSEEPDEESEPGPKKGDDGCSVGGAGTHRGSLGDAFGALAVLLTFLRWRRRREERGVASKN